MELRCIGLVNLLKCADRFRNLGGIEPEGNADIAAISIHAFECLHCEVTLFIHNFVQFFTQCLFTIHTARRLQLSFPKPFVVESAYGNYRLTVMK